MPGSVIAVRCQEGCVCRRRSEERKRGQGDHEGYECAAGQPVPGNITAGLTFASA